MNKWYKRLTYLSGKFAQVRQGWVKKRPFMQNNACKALFVHSFFAANYRILAYFRWYYYAYKLCCSNLRVNDAAFSAKGAQPSRKVPEAYFWVGVSVKFPNSLNLQGNAQPWGKNTLILAGKYHQLTNGCAAHDWGQMCRFQGKIRSHFRSFTRG